MSEAALAARCADLEDALSRVRSDLSAAAAELDRQQRFTDVLLETIPVGIAVCDKDGGGWVRNRAEREMLGLEAHGEGGRLARGRRNDGRYP